MDFIKWIFTKKFYIKVLFLYKNLPISPLEDYCFLTIFLKTGLLTQEFEALFLEKFRFFDILYCQLNAEPCILKRN